MSNKIKHLFLRKEYTTTNQLRSPINFIHSHVTHSWPGIKPAVLKLGSIEPQGFGESVSCVQQEDILSNESKKNKIYDTHFIFATTKGSMNACMELVGFSTPSKVKNH